MSGAGAMTVAEPAAPAAVDPDVAAVAEAAAGAVDGEALVELVRAAVGIPSITGAEGEFADWVAAQLASGGWDEVRTAEVASGRPNVYGVAGAPGWGRSLVLAGHLDTVATDDWRAHWHGTDRADPFGAHLVDGAIWGRGVADQKAGICATIEALRALGRTGHRPAGPVTALFVCDEESGQPGSGVSAGMRAALGDVLGAAPAADFAIYTEPTTSAIYTAQMGFLIADVCLEGRSAYFGTPELGIDALRAGHALLSDLWRHSAELAAAGRHELLGEAFLLVTRVNAGGNIAVPGRFELSLIRKILPGEDLDGAAEDIRRICEAVAARHGTSCAVTFSAPRDHTVGGTPDEIPADDPGVAALGRSVEAVTGAPARIAGAPYWSEKPFLASLGIPGVYFAPGDISCCHTPFECLAIDELISATRTLAHFVASWCGVQKLQTTPG
ncbi:MAG: M20 family metallopeptidase [bacterium]|nr:M20 family metallopeptidase [bacterium]MDE0669741.1 M20 family metallopeptidase [bacterium]MYB24094.1 M20 family metallopeptidase [Acidimicrobiia bacterium]